jgi:hypothetical protein
MSSNILAAGHFFFSVGLCAVAKMDSSENPENHASHVGRHSVSRRRGPQPSVTPLLNHSLLQITGVGISSFGLQVSPFQYVSSHTDQFTYQFI